MPLKSPKLILMFDMLKLIKSYSRGSSWGMGREVEEEGQSYSLQKDNKALEKPQALL